MPREQGHGHHGLPVAGLDCDEELRAVVGQNAAPSALAVPAGSQPCTGIGGLLQHLHAGCSVQCISGAAVRPGLPADTRRPVADLHHGQLQQLPAKSARLLWVLACR